MSLLPVVRTDQGLGGGGGGGGGELRCMIFSIFIILCKGLFIDTRTHFSSGQESLKQKRHREERLL